VNNSLQKFVEAISPKTKVFLVGTCDFVFLTLTFLISTTWSLQVSLQQALTPALIFGVLCVLFSVFLRNYRILWSLFSIRDLYSLAISVLTAITLVALLDAREYGLGFYALVGLVSFNGLVFLRILFANWRDLFGINLNDEKVVILGAGAAGAQIYDQLKSSPALKTKPVGFLDDDLGTKRRSVKGAPVLGTIQDIEKIKQTFGVSKAILAIPSATTKQVSAIHALATKAGVDLKTLPSLSQVLDGKVNLSQIKDIEPEDLLGRDPIILSDGIVRDVIGNETVLVTGAGGSIGSELCFQIAKLSPKKLVLFEQTELFLYEVEMRIRSLFPNIEIVAVVGDVRNLETVEKAIKTHSPSTIFHAAAYKHVPLMEDNPIEALSTNLTGTRNVASTAAKFATPRFVLVSTDKAVNPTNVMGATKRAAELACQIISEDNPNTKFMVVRFGNVLGSSGSVIPLFKKQIENGGPVTVTHENIIRYFMSIPEACQLVMYAGAIGSGGELFVLDMGDPVKIVDLATDMIRLSGFEPGVNMHIKFTGLRKGEKMFEELLLDKENTIETAHPKIRVANRTESDADIRARMTSTLGLPRNTDPEKVIEALKMLVPEFSQETLN
jgi:FlaA1/EpsC-like NDP-sugar epimerase